MPAPKPSFRAEFNHAWSSGSAAEAALVTAPFLDLSCMPM
jgi:hypothetical protein